MTKRGMTGLIQDAWTSVLSGIGTSRDKGRVSAVRYCGSPILDEQTLQEAYRGNWLVRRIVNDVPQDATRRGYGTDPEEVPEFDRLNYAKYAEGALVRAANLARLMGGSGLYIGYANGGADLKLPAPEGAEVAFLEVFHRYDLQAVEYTRESDTSSPTYGQPQVWKVVGQYRSGLEFHESRMIKFPGQPRADDFDTVTGSDRDWDDSVLQACWEDAIRYGLFWQQVGHLMSISSVGVLKIAGLIEMLASKSVETAEARVDLLNEMLSSTRLMMLDAKHDESYHREPVSFSDVPALLQELQLATAGAVGEPVTKLFGRSPAGMNATGESDMRLWYDSVDTWRELVLKPRAERLMSICERKPVKIEWPSLVEPTELEVQQTRQALVGTNERLWSMGVASDAEIRQALHEGRPVEEYLKGAPTAEPTRAVTQIQVVEPNENAAAPIDPDAPDDSPLAKARALLDSTRQDVSEFWDRSSTQMIAEAEAKLAKANVKFQRQVTRYQTSVERNAPKIAKLHAAAEPDADALVRLEEGPAERFAEAVLEYDDAVGAAASDLHAEIESIDANPDEGDRGGQQERRAKLVAAVSEFDQISARTSEVAAGLYDRAGNVQLGKVREAAARATQVGPRGGVFYISGSGSKVYV